MATHGYRRALGQHYLKDSKVINTIADTAIELALKKSCRAILEIGPGKGAITFPILVRRATEPSLEEVILIERDRSLVEGWQSREPNARIEAGDFLDMPEEKWLTSAPLAVVSNLPYSAGTAILTRLARHPSKIRVMVLMFQAEVARRLRADVSTKEWGSLSIWIQNRWDVKKLLHVPPGAFSPPPDVDSEVVILEPRSEPRIAVPGDAQSEALWEKLLSVCFAHRRKMLRSGLPKSGPDGGKWIKTLELSGVDGTKRAEALTWEEWQKLFAAAQQTD